MPKYRDLKERIDGGETIILDGAVGTQLQAMEVPNDPYCWAAIANHTHPSDSRRSRVPGRHLRGRHNHQCGYY